MKVVQAFSWALFAAYLIALHVLFKLIEHAKRLGRYDINYTSIRGQYIPFSGAHPLFLTIRLSTPTEIPWFYEMPGYYPTEGRYGHYAGGGYPQYPMPSAGQPMSMQPAMPVNSAAQQPQVTHITV